MKSGKKITDLIPFLWIGILAFMAMPVTAQRMGPFCSFAVNTYSNGQETIGPYIGTVKYFGFFEEGSIADDTSQHKCKYYFYFTLPQSTNEIGARALSPIPTTVIPGRGDQVSINYFENVNNNSEFFDPVIVIEKCVDNPNGQGVWVELGSNDDSEELPAQPTGDRKNALIRVANDSADASKMLVPGLYRVVVMDKFGRPAVGGCFLQIGTTTPSNGLWLYKSPAEMSVRNFSCKY